MNCFMQSLVYCICFSGIGDAIASETHDHRTEIEHIRVHVAKGGRGSIEIACAVSGGKTIDLTSLDILAEYGATNRRMSFADIGEGKKRVKCSGEFADILQLFRILDSSSPFLLSHTKAFDIAWDRGVLKIRLKYGTHNEGTVDNLPNVPTLEVTTDGHFTKHTSGDVNQERTKTIVRSARELVLEIEHLGID